MKIGILGPGRMAGTMARTLMAIEDIQRLAVASRNRERAEQFAMDYGFERVYDSYEAMLADPDVELVYIATPHSHHFEQMKALVVPLGNSREISIPLSTDQGALTEKQTESRVHR